MLSGVKKIQSHSSPGQMHSVCQWCSAIPRASSQRNSCQIDFFFFSLALHKGWNFWQTCNDHHIFTQYILSVSQNRPPELLAEAKELHWGPFCLLAKAEKEWVLLRNTLPSYSWVTLKWDHNNWAVRSWTPHPAGAGHFLHQSHQDWIIQLPLSYSRHYY